MNGVWPASDAGAAAWLLRERVDWWDLVRYGPPGFPTYVRVAFLPPGAPGDDGDHEYDAVRAALDVLAVHTTSTNGYAAVWEGWGGNEPAPIAPRIDIPNRAMLLFTGPIDALRLAPGRAWGESPPYSLVPPHLVWAADRAWCLACEVDEDLAFTAGCSRAAAQALADALPVTVRAVPYGAKEPLYADER